MEESLQIILQHLKYGKEGGNATIYLNLELIEDNEGRPDFSKILSLGKTRDSEDFGRIIFYTENVDRLFSYMKQDEYISKHNVIENGTHQCSVGRKVLSYS